MSLFNAVSSEDMQTARIVTGATMAAFIAVGLVPGFRQRAAMVRGVLLVLYLLTCGAYIGYMLLR